MRELLNKIKEYEEKYLYGEAQQITDLPERLQNEINKRVMPEIVAKGMTSIKNFLSQF